MNVINVLVDKNDIGLGNVDNTSDLNKPISNATQTALNDKENLSNKSTDGNLGNSDISYPSQKAVKTYVDNKFAVISVGDATATTKGVIKLTGDLSGTAESPTVPGLANKENTITPGLTSEYWRGDKSWATLNKTAVGLGNVDNTSDLNKPISTAVQTALNLKQDTLGYTPENQSNKENTTLDNSTTKYPTNNLVKNTLSNYLLASLKGSVNGLAELDGSGKIPSAQLPSYVDDILEFATLSAFPLTGESGKIYIAIDTNVSYRWSGSVYVEISSSLALGETSATAYRGDRGKIAYDHSQTTGNPHGATTNDIPDYLNKRYVTDAEKTILSNTSGTNTGDQDLSGLVPYTGATNDVDLGAHIINAQSFHVKGTGGNGHFGLKHQSADATANANETALYADVNGDLKYKNDGGFRTTLKTSLNTGDRVYTFPDRSGTLADNTDLATKQDALGFTPENSANKNAVNGYVGRSSGAIVFPDLINDFTSLIKNVNTASREYYFPDKNGTVAMTSDLTGKQDAITLTTSGSSGPATLVGSTLNIPQYSGGASVVGSADYLYLWNNFK